MQYRTETTAQTHNSYRQPEETKPDLRELRFKLYTARSSLTKRLYRTPTADELWSELGNIRYAEFMDLLEAEIKMLLLDRRDAKEVLNTCEIHKFCDEWGINDFHRSNILEWAVAAGVITEKNDLPYSAMTDISLFLSEKNHIPVFREYTDDAAGNQIQIFDDDKKAKLRAKLNCITVTGEFITPRVFNTMLRSFEVPKARVSEIAEYVISLNRSLMTGNTPAVPAERQDSDIPDFNSAAHPASEPSPQNKTALREKEEQALPDARPADPPVVYDSSQPVIPLNPVHMFNMLDRREVLQDGTEPGFSHSSGTGRDQDDAENNPMEQFCHELALLLYSNSTQTKLFCDMPVLFLKTGEVRQISVFSAKEEMPALTFEHGNSVLLLTRNYSSRTLTLTFSTHNKGVTILRLTADRQSSLKIVIFVL